jgi:hypothetical protein
MMRRRSQARDSFAAVRYAVDTGAMPPPRRPSLLARHKRVVLPLAAVTLLGAAFFAKEARRVPAEIPAAALDCTSARDVWRPACRPENVQSWVAKAASARDESPAATGAIEEQGKRASTPKRIAAGSSKPESKPATPEPVRVAEAKPEPVRAAPPAAEPAPQVRTLEAVKPEPVRAAEAKPEPQPVRPAPAPVAAVTALPERQATHQAATLVAPEPPARPAALQVEQPSKPEPLPVIAEPPRAPVKVTAEPAAPSPAEADESARRKRHDRLAARTARREAARTVALAEKREAAAQKAAELAEKREAAAQKAAELAEKREAAAQKAAALAEKREAQRARAPAARREEQQAPPRRLARVRPAEPGIRTTAYFPPGFVQALRAYNGRYAYDY